ncbi:unnamed protein product [Trichogramma brassicae]|uniref:CCHC-type domain-containing protein n=1 Tax=Trichogramma brassicae TaxID=86971 RepID=A0A6H5ICX1_9HYME|nr:unnamed protein product [Trichogramma brassicae]
MVNVLKVLMKMCNVLTALSARRTRASSDLEYAGATCLIDRSPSNESITAAHRHSIVHGRISRCETLTIECRYSLFPSLQSTSCSGINLGGCPFDSRHGQDRPEERVALPESHDPQVIDLSLQAPTCCSNELSTCATSSNESVAHRRRDLTRRRCLSTSSWLVDPGSDQKPSAPPSDEEAVVEPSPPPPPPPSTTHRDAPTPSYRSIAEIEKIMPYFDGKNMSVAQFIHDCKVAKRFLRPADNEFFTALLKVRVKDGANCYLQHKIFTSDDEIYDELKRAYAPSRGLLPDLLGNLSRARQGADEKVVDYGLRISRQLRAASDNIRENLEPNLVPGDLESAAISALASFTRGLRKEVEEVVDRQNPKSLEAAIDLAIMAEAKIADRVAFDNDPPKNFQRVRSIQPSSQTPRLCFKCNKEGHIARYCRAPRPGVICRNCNKEGHIARYCPENLNENASRQSNATATRPSQSAFRTESSWRSTLPLRTAATELNYAAIEKELLAIVFAVQHFRPYLYGRKFTIVTDHKPLVWLHNLKNPTSRLARWKEKLRDYDYEIVHKPGKVNANADALSRNPVPISSPKPISPSADDYEHEIERRIFSINCLPEVRERESHRGLAKDGQKVDRQGELARPGGSPQGTAGAQESLREELNPRDYHRAVSSYGQEFHLGDLASPNDLRCHHVSSLHADRHESHLEEFLHLERRVSHLSTPPDEPSHRKRNADEMETLTDDDEVGDEWIEARVPSEFADKAISKTYNDIIDDIARKLNITLKEAHDKIIEAKQKSKAYYDLKNNVRTFSPGDHVYLLKEHKTDKLDDHYTGPYLIKQLIGDRNDEIELGPSRSKIVHVDKLKPAFLRL